MFLQSHPVIVDSQLRHAWYSQPKFALGTALLASCQLKRSLMRRVRWKGTVVELNVQFPINLI
jgi:hypothetical protein